MFEDAVEQPLNLVSLAQQLADTLPMATSGGESIQLQIPPQGVTKTTKEFEEIQQKVFQQVDSEIFLKLVGDGTESLPRDETARAGPWTSSPIGREIDEAPPPLVADDAPVGATGGGYVARLPSSSSGQGART